MSDCLRCFRFGEARCDAHRPGGIVVPATIAAELIEALRLGRTLRRSSPTDYMDAIELHAALRVEGET